MTYFFHPGRKRKCYDEFHTYFGVTAACDVTNIHVHVWNSNIEEKDFIISGSSFILKEESLITHMYTLVYVCTHMYYTPTHVRAFTYIHVYMYISICTLVDIHMHLLTCICIAYMSHTW